MRKPPSIKKLIQLADKWKPFAEIGALFGLTGSEVGKLLRQANYIYPVSDDELLAIAIKKNKKMSLREIGQRIGKHPYYLSKALKDAGVKVIRHPYISKKPLPPDKALLAMYGTRESPGKPMSQIAQETGADVTQIHKRLRQLGVDTTIHQNHIHKVVNPVVKLPSKAELHELFKSNTPEEIAEMYGVTIDAVYKKASFLPSRAKLKTLLESMTVEEIAQLYQTSPEDVLRKANTPNVRYLPKPSQH